ncbi:xylose isomerase, partial [Bacillus subtilis]|nr:xylose isomerase [Bacillus subtilis]
MAQSHSSSTKYFGSANKVVYEGKDSTNPLAFKYYNPQEVIGGKTMKEHLRFSIAYWHTFTADGTDVFGAATMQRPWDHYKG